MSQKNSIDFVKLQGGQNRAASFSFSNESTDPHVLFALAKLESKFECESEWDTSSQLSIRIVDASTGNLVEDITKSDHAAKLPVGKFKLVFTANGVGACSVASIHFAAVWAGVPSTSNSSGSPTGAPTSSDASAADTARRNRNELLLETRLTHLVFMSQKEGCIPEYSRSLAELLEANPVLKKTDSPFVVRKEFGPTQSEFSIEKNVAGNIFTIYNFRSFPSDDFNSIWLKLLDGKEFKFSSNPQCMGEGVSYVAHSNRFVEAEAGSFANQEFSLAKDPTDASKANFLVSYSTVPSSFFLKIRAGLELNETELATFPETVRVSLFDSSADLRLTEWQDMKKSDLALVQLSYTDPLLLHRILPRLANLKVVFDLSKSDLIHFSPQRFLNIGSVCKGALSKTYFTNESGSASNCSTILESDLP